MRRRSILLLMIILLANWNPGISQDFTADFQEGCDTLTVTFTYDSPVTATNIEWDFGNGQTSAELAPIPVFYDSPGKYSVTIIVNNTLIKTKSEFIIINPGPEATFTYADTSFSDAFDIVLHAGAQENDTINYTYTWLLPGNERQTGDRIATSFANAGTYAVELLVEDDRGCADRFLQEITVMETLQIPNVFTPNNDGINDLFIVPTDGNTVYAFHIFSRTGIEIYRSQAPSIVWDGYTSAGIEASKGIYYYVIESQGQNADAVSRAGFFYLFR